MKKSIRLLLLASACLLALTACGDKNKKPGSASSSAPTASSSETPTASKGDAALSAADARSLLSENIDTETYMILDSNTSLTAKGADYHVFIIANRADNKPVGQVAVNKETGEKFNYEGEGVLSDYSEFSLFDPDTDVKHDWDGVFSDGTRTLELLPMDNSSFEYTVGELTGVARISGGTAEDAENSVTFTFGADRVLTLSGGVQGTFTPAS